MRKEDQAFGKIARGGLQKRDKKRERKMFGEIPLPGHERGKEREKD